MGIVDTIHSNLIDEEGISLVNNENNNKPSYG